MTAIVPGVRVWVEKRRRVGVVVECDTLRKGQVCVELNSTRAPYRRHYNAAKVEVHP